MVSILNWGYATLGQDCAWMGGFLRTPGVAGMGSDIFSSLGRVDSGSTTGGWSVKVSFRLEHPKVLQPSQGGQEITALLYRPKII